MNYYEIIGVWVKAIRKAKGISIENLCTLTGLTNAEIEKIESGKMNIRLSTFASLSEGLEVCIYSLMPDSFFGVVEPQSLKT